MVECQESPRLILFYSATLVWLQQQILLPERKSPTELKSACPGIHAEGDGLRKTAAQAAELTLGQLLPEKSSCNQSSFSIILIVVGKPQEAVRHLILRLSPAK